MLVFFIWILIIGLFLALYSAILWKRNRRQSLFQAKLTILFLLFILIPTIPLTLFVANIFTKSADMLLLPGIGTALETSLVTIRSQVEEKGRMFLSAHPDPKTWNPQMLKQEKILFAGYYQMARDSIRVVRLCRLSDGSVPSSWRPGRDFFIETSGSSQYSCLIPSGGGQLISVCEKIPPVSLIVAAYPVSSEVLGAKEEITRALNIYNTLTLLKETIIQKNMIWAVASLIIVLMALLANMAAKKLSRGISEPIQELVHGMRRIASGDFTHEVTVRAKDEIGFLVEAFNRMMKDLQTTREKLVQAEKRAAWQEAARRISHEIRNNLTPLFISLRRMKTVGQQETLPPQILDNLGTMEEELVSLEHMSSAFSEFARLPEPQKSRFQLNELVEAAVRIAENDAGPVRIFSELSPQSTTVEADREQIKRLLHNLIKNAVEASHENGIVTVRTRKLENSLNGVLIEIEDHGEGMDSETLQKLFQPYFTTKKKGTGLGLVIAQKIVEDHGGKIEFHSKKGKGTTVQITFSFCS